MARCNGCGCTDERACDVGCEWVFISKSLKICSACAGTERDLDATLRCVDRLLTETLNGKNSGVTGARYMVRQARSRHSLTLALRSDAQERANRKPSRRGCVAAMAPRKKRKR